MIGGLIMTHGDDLGLRTPPKVAPTQLVIVPIYKADAERARVLEAADRIAASLTGVRVEIDRRDGMTPGAKYFYWELRGIPLRLELGPRDLDKEQCVLVRRDTREKRPTPLAVLSTAVPTLLSEIQADMFRVARDRREANSIRGPISYDKFREIMDGEGAFVYAGWCGDAACEAQIKEDTKATIRVLPDPEFRSPQAPTTCLRCGRPSTAEALWAKAY
jgi:prolyl-tRNA synthetase